MNQRIRSIAEGAGFSLPIYAMCHKELEKFAEGVVKEAIYAIREANRVHWENLPNCSKNFPPEFFVSVVKDHFLLD